MSTLREMLHRAAKEARPSAQEFWEDLNLRISKGEVIPIISDSVRTERIFDLNYDYDLDRSTADGDLRAPDLQRQGDAPPPTDLTTEDGDLHAPDLETENGDRRAPDADKKDKDDRDASLNVEEELAKVWADHIKYPLVHDKHRMARVAVYNSVYSKDDQQAKAGYLQFLKDLLLGFAKQDTEVAGLVPELREQRDGLSFAAIASELGYPKYKSADDDPLRRLARLRLPIYITTSYHDYMERALAEEVVPFKTQICFLSGTPRNVAPEHRPDPDLRPSKEQSIVYHLHGYEDYASSMILSEDDYLDFLVRVSEEARDSVDSFIPLYLKEALAESSLMLLGYRLHDWDFRVVFRGLIKAKHASLRKFGLAIQLDPKEQREIKDIDRAREYLKTYFKPVNFIVAWGRTDEFVKELCGRYDKWRGASDEQDEQSE